MEGLRWWRSEARQASDRQSTAASCAAAAVRAQAKEEAKIGNEGAGRERADAGVLRRALARLCRTGQDVGDARPLLAPRGDQALASVGH